MDLKRFLTAENVGGWDLFLRALIGSILISLLAAGYIPQDLKAISALVAAATLFTSITRHCSPYELLGVSTAKKK